jgi:hypothetical protein
MPQVQAITEPAGIGPSRLQAAAPCEHATVADSRLWNRGPLV